MLQFKMLCINSDHHVILLKLDVNIKLPMLKILFLTVVNERKYIIRTLKLVDEKLYLRLQSHTLNIHIKTHAQFTHYFRQNILHAFCI